MQPQSPARPRPLGSYEAADERLRRPPQGTDTLAISALFCLGVLGGVFAWWAVKQGAYFGVTMLPGILVLCLALALLARWSPWRGDLDLSRPVKAALFGLLGLAGWSALSALWSPSPDVAVADALRIAGYAVCFGLGLWLCNLLGPRMHLAQAPVAIAAGVAGAVALGALIIGDDIRSYLDGDGTLQYPLGYRNATAAFFLVALWPALGLARARDLGWGWRALALATATLCVEMALLCQSRGSIPAAAVALAIYVALTRDRARAIAWLALAALPAVVVVPAMTDLYSAVNTGSLLEGIEEMHAAGRAALGGPVIAAALALVAVRVEPRVLVTPKAEERANLVATRGVIAMLAMGAIAFLVAVGNPIDFFEQRVDEFRTKGSPAFEGQSSRFSLDAGTERLDLWGVALEDAGSDPLFGDGAGGFQYSYMRQRSNADQNAKDAHSVELEVLAELGLPGLALFGVAVAGAATGAMRSRRLGPSASALSGAALTSGAYWLTHASIDWFWTYAAVTAPVVMLLGAACAPAILAPRQPRGSGRRWTVIGAALLCALVIPVYLSERYTNNAFQGWRADPERAFADLDRARALNPLAEEPWLAEGAIARESGDSDREVSAFRGAVSERPEEWAAHYFLAQAYLDRNAALARSELDVALELNPLSARLKGLEEELQQAEKEAGKGGGKKGR